MMEKDASKRIASAAEVASRLEPWSTDALGVGGLSMTRSPWMAPPLLSSEEEREVEREVERHVEREGEGAARGPSIEPATGQASFSDGALANTSVADGPLDTALSSDVGGVQPPLPGFDVSPRYPALPTESPDAPPPAAGLSPGLIIALTIAIVLPPALLLGAILGYLAAH